MTRTTVAVQWVRLMMATACMFAVIMSPLHGQEMAACAITLRSPDFVSASADIARAVDLFGERAEQSFMIRRASDVVEQNACGAPGSILRLARRLSDGVTPAHGARVLPVDVRAAINTAYPRDWNDGVMWSGVGLSSAVTAGAELRWGVLEAALAPVLGFQQNTQFDTHKYPETSAYSRYIDRWHGRYIDRPQRFGSDAIGTADIGQSYVRVNTRGFRAGISHENLAWGPARRNALLLSGTAPGFGHVFMETARPHDVWIGDASVQLFWGRLTESSYFDYNPDNDHRALGGVVITLRPRGLDGLFLGAGHLHMQPWDDNTSTGDILAAPFTGTQVDSSGLPRDLRMLSLFMRWAAAPAGFEVYGEWARQDAWGEWFHLMNEVEAPQAYTLGIQKLVRHGSKAVRLSAEFSHLSDAVAHRDLGRGIHTYYVSPHVVQGHTHRGQLLGAPIGPGSEAQFIGADLFWVGGRSSLSVERVRYDDDAYYSVWGQNHGPHGHDTEMSFRAGHLFAHDHFSIEAEVGYSFRYSRSLLGLHHVNSPNFPYRRDTNYGVRLSGRWQPRLPSWDLR